jgi:hypothetical protein
VDTNIKKTFIDDFSRKTWIYFMKTKDEVFNGSRSSRLRKRTWWGRIAGFQ